VNNPAGFYPDSTNGGRLRYWDGQAWTAQFQDQLLAAQSPEVKKARPMWKRKRVLIPAVLLAVIGAAVAGGNKKTAVSSSKAPAPSAEAAATSTAGASVTTKAAGTIAKASTATTTKASVAANPPEADVAVQKCAADGGKPAASLTVVNHSSKRSDYVISAGFVSGGVRGDDATAFITDLKPGQTVTVAMTGTKPAGEDFTCDPYRVDRIASTDDPSAQADIKISSCANGADGDMVATVQATNGSSKVSSYLVTVVVESADGATQYGTHVAAIDKVAPGASATGDAGGYTSYPAGYVCSAYASRHASA
jgi:hypothetical protein